MTRAIQVFSPLQGLKREVGVLSAPFGVDKAFRAKRKPDQNHPLISTSESRAVSRPLLVDSRRESESLTCEASSLRFEGFGDI